MTTEETNRLKVIVCRPLEKAEVIEINDDLDTMQSLVGGMIEEWKMSLSYATTKEN